MIEEFKQKKDELIEQVHAVLNDALEGLGKNSLSKPLHMDFTAQGGVGTANEHNLLLDNYGVDLVGWGTPFLLVPEAVNIDTNSFKLLSEAGEDELYLSDISPIGVPYSILRKISVVITRTGASRLTDVSPVTNPTFSVPNRRRKSRNFWFDRAFRGGKKASKIGELISTKQSNWRQRMGCY